MTVLLVLIAMAGYTVHRVGVADERAAQDRAASAARGRTIDSQQDAISRLSNQVRGLGGTPVATSTGAAPVPAVDIATVVRDVLAQLPHPRDGRDGRPGQTPSAAQIEAAVTAVCAKRGCGPPEQQIAGAVAAYLVVNPPPSGPPGPTGVPGQDGHDGKDGRDGRDGVDGVGIASISDVVQNGPQCTITITLTSGATKDLTWTCQPAPPTPTPEPTVLSTLPGGGGDGGG